MIRHCLMSCERKLILLAGGQEAVEITWKLICEKSPRCRAAPRRLPARSFVRARMRAQRKKVVGFGEEPGFLADEKCRGAKPRLRDAVHLFPRERGRGAGADLAETARDKAPADAGSWKEPWPCPVPLPKDTGFGLLQLEGWGQDAAQEAPPVYPPVTCGGVPLLLLLPLQ
ncbi:uncharacterized protein M6G45_014348 [Spheniscus humboldti]